MKPHRALMVCLGLSFFGACGNASSGGQDASASDDAGVPSPDGGIGAIVAAESVLQHHKNPSRDGLYTDPAITRASAALAKRDLSFAATLTGKAYAQPLYLATQGGQDILIVATEQNHVYALDAATGAVVWHRSDLGPAVALSNLPCGNIDPLGITGTPIVDVASRTVFLDTMTSPDGGRTKTHLVWGLSVDDGSTRPGWPVNVNAKAKFGTVTFDSAHQNQRGALALLNGTVYVPYGGHYGDCGTYYGWVVGISVANPASVTAWATRASGAGAWSPGGVAHDGANLFVATGNSFGATTWADGEAHIRLPPSLVFSQAIADYWAPTNWRSLDGGDVDIGGSGPVLFSAPGATPSSLDIVLGKDGNAYLVDRGNMGGVSNAVAKLGASAGTIIQAAIAYNTPTATYVAFKGTPNGCPGGGGGNLGVMKVSRASPPVISMAWCNTVQGNGSPMVTTTDGTNEAVVWWLAAEGTNRLYAYDGDTGAVIFDGGAANEAFTPSLRFIPPIAAKGRIYIATGTNVYALNLK